MTHTLIDLPFDENALEPFISKETLEYHHGKHHAAYVNNLNRLIENTTYANMNLEAIIISASGGIFNNAAQVYNHDFYFKGMGRKITSPSKELLEVFNRDFGSLEAFKEIFLETATGLFGSGWVWLSIDNSGSLILESFSNAGNPLLSGHTPLLTCDVWEHAYYLNYMADRKKYINNFWKVVNWDKVSKKYEGLI